LRTNAVLNSESLLGRRELEAINLAVSELSGCDYCLAAHTLAGKAAGYTNDQLHALRVGNFADDAKIAALVHFARLLVQSTGTLPVQALEAVRHAGYSDRQIVEAIGASSAILFTNLLNRVNDTTLDFARAEPAIV
ncbi:MAG: carboxymuconolactone decarboxylase family protein, partial [Chitinophagaceae bacterium]|nr:carboxymuconolactone decarboxylase family protein [Rubrivivax sp.]